MKTLDLGCGPKSKMEGSIGLDMRPAPHVDVVHDLNDIPYPFEEDTFDHVEMSHVIEHVDRPLRVMAEVHRITKPGGRIRIITPHYSSQLSYGDMEHFHHLGYITFLTLSRTGLFTMEKHKLWFTDIYKWAGIAWLANQWPRRWEKYHAFVYPALYVEVFLRVEKPDGRDSGSLVEEYMY